MYSIPFTADVVRTEKLTLIRYSKSIYNTKFAHAHMQSRNVSALYSQEWPQDSWLVDPKSQVSCLP